MLASYTSGDFGIRFASLPELEHVQYVLNAMIEIHGEVAREQYTGKYNRYCWALDPLESASWASPSIGMHKLYIPAFFRTENHVSQPLWSGGQRRSSEADDIYRRAHKVSAPINLTEFLVTDFMPATHSHGVSHAASNLTSWWPEILIII